MAAGDRVHLLDGSDRHATVVADPDPESGEGDVILVFADEDAVVAYESGARVADHVVGIAREQTEPG